MTPDTLPAAAALTLAALTARGATLTMPIPGRLTVQPADAASADDLDALASGRPWLLAAWTTAAAHDAEHPPLPDLDPLPPLPGDDDGQADADAWGAALALAAAADGADPFGLTGALRFARSMGARLRRTAGGSLALRMPSGHPEAGVVAEALSGHGEALRCLLALVAADDDDDCQRAA